MDGFVDMALKLTENVFLIFSLKELFAYAFPAELSESLELLWKGVIGSSSWMGYAGYALYGVGLDYNFATEVCEAFGYGYYVIDGMNYIVAFAQPSEDGSPADPLAMAAAAADALSQATGVDLSAVTDGISQVDELTGGALSGALDGVIPSGTAAEGEAAAAEGEAAAAEGEAAAEDTTAAEGSG